MKPAVCPREASASVRFDEVARERGAAAQRVDKQASGRRGLQRDQRRHLVAGEVDLGHAWLLEAAE